MEKQFEAGSVLISFWRDPTFLRDSCESLKPSLPEDVLNYPRCHLEVEPRTVCEGISRSQASSQKLTFCCFLLSSSGGGITPQKRGSPPFAKGKAKAQQVAGSASGDRHQTLGPPLFEENSKAHIVKTPGQGASPRAVFTPWRTSWPLCRQSGSCSGPPMCSDTFCQAPLFYLEKK